MSAPRKKAGSVSTLLLTPCCKATFSAAGLTVVCQACGSSFPSGDGFIDFVGETPNPPGLIQWMWQDPTVVSVYTQVRSSIQALVAGTVTDERSEAVMLKNFLDPEPGNLCLDLGCGEGRHVGTVLDAVGNQGGIIGVDISRPMLARFASRLGHQAKSRVALARASATSLPLADSSVDRAFAVAFLHLLPDPRPCLAEVRRVLKPGGVFVFTQFVRGRWTGLAAVEGLMKAMLGVWFNSVDDLVRLTREAGFGDVEAAAIHPLMIVRAR